MPAKLPLPDDLAALVATGSITEKAARKRAKDRRWRDKHLDEAREKLRCWREENRWRDRENSRRWKEENREKFLEQQRQWRRDNPEAQRERSRRRRKENPEVSYVASARGYLKARYGVSDRALVELLLINRAIKRELRKEQTP